MGLEITGYTVSNLEQLWIDPFEYQGNLNLQPNRSRSGE
jgi:hypothetical protein